MDPSKSMLRISAIHRMLNRLKPSGIYPRSTSTGYHRRCFAEPPGLSPFPSPGGRGGKPSGCGRIRSQEPFEMRLNTGPFVVDDAEIDAVANPSLGHDHVVAKGAL